MRALRPLFSKLPIRQVTSSFHAHTIASVSKLPIRQVTWASARMSFSLLSKLPIRQVTTTNLKCFIVIISKLPIRQVTFWFWFWRRFWFSKLPIRQVTTIKPKKSRIKINRYPVFSVFTLFQTACGRLGDTGFLRPSEKKGQNNGTLAPRLRPWLLNVPSVRAAIFLSTASR